jgi:hypothetical protein
MADNNIHFGAGSGEGKTGGIDHASELLRIIGNDSHSPAQKMDAIQNHPHLTASHKAQGMDFLSKQAGGGIQDTGTATGKGGLGPRPVVHHADIDYDGSAVNLTDGQKAANAKSREAQAVWDEQSKPKGPSMSSPKTLVGRAPFSGGGPTPKVAKATMGTKEISAKLGGLHTLLTTYGNTANSLKTLAPEHRDYLKAAKGHLDDATTHMSLGNRTLGSNTPDTNEQATHFGHAMGFLTQAHEMLSHAPLQRALKNTSVTAELPHPDHIAEMAGHVGSMRGKGASGVPGAQRPYSSVKVGKSTISTKNISPEDIKAAEETGGKESIVTKKLKAGLRGSPSKDTSTERRAVSQVAGNTGNDAGTGDKKGMTYGAVNPKRRGSSRKLETRFSSDGNKVGQTPTPGESGAVGRIKGEANPYKLPTDEAKKNPNSNIGGRGGAV